MQSSILSQALIQGVSEQYERFPYPNYPLLAKPRCADGFMGSSDFAGRLCRINRNLGEKHLLIAGCGEILPYVLRHLEPRTHHLHCVDLSNRSLDRARFRCRSPLNLFRRKNLNFEQVDLDAYLSRMILSGTKFAHFDAYGVLQCLPNPAQTLQKIAAVLSDQGSMRIMVYNNHARGWIHDIAKIFQLLHLDYRKAKDLRQAQKILKLIHAELPFMKRIFSGGLTSIVRNRARLVDTFFHQRDISYSIADWYQAIEQSGLSLVGLVDRYGELDDLKNPLWHAPSMQALSERAADFRFENNLELYLCKVGPESFSPQQSAFASQVQVTEKRYSRIRRGLRLLCPTLPFADSYTYPRLWFSFSETRLIPVMERLRIWQAHRDFTTKGLIPPPRLFKPYSIQTLQRLARLGAILPGMLDELISEDELCRPLCDAMQSPERAQSIDLSSTVLVTWLRQCLIEKKIYSEKRLQIILARLQQAQTKYAS